MRTAYNPCKFSERTAFSVVQQVEAASPNTAGAVEQIVGDVDLLKQVIGEIIRQKPVRGRTRANAPE
jgi:hypothetical protein